MLVQIASVQLESQHASVTENISVDWIIFHWLWGDMTKVAPDLWPGRWVCQRRWVSPLCWGVGTCWWFGAGSAAPHPDTHGPTGGGSPVCLEKHTHRLLSESSRLHQTDEHSDCSFTDVNSYCEFPNYSEISNVHCIVYISVVVFFLQNFNPPPPKYYSWIQWGKKSI